jgi:hypothetical protein
MNYIYLAGLEANSGLRSEHSGCMEVAEFFKEVKDF